MTRTAEALPKSLELKSDTFDTEFRKRLVELGIQILPLPATSHEILVDRDLGKRKPFKQGSGYRDALIWHSIIDSLDSSVHKLVLVTQNTDDFSNPKLKNQLHDDLLTDLKGLSWAGAAEIVDSPKTLAENQVKPLLRQVKKLETGLEQLATDIANDSSPLFILSEVVQGSLEDFEGQEANDLSFSEFDLDEPINVTSVEEPENITMSGLYPLVSGQFMLEGTADVKGTVEGFMMKFEAFNLSEQGRVFISTPDWNEHYSEVEISDVPLRISYSFKFSVKTGDVTDFEITNFEAL